MVSTRLIGWRTLPLPLAGPASGRGSAVPMSLYLDLMGDCSRLAGRGTIAAACVLRYRSLRSMVLRKTRSTGAVLRKMLRASSRVTGLGN
jgi:hypothetical protein